MNWEFCYLQWSLDGGVLLYLRGPLAGRRVGVLPNGKLDSDRLLMAVVEWLRAEHGLPR